MGLKVVRKKGRALIVDGADVLSDVLDHPGPTHDLFDVLAAAVCALTPGPRVLILGFAGGGMVAPLRALGFSRRIEAVDLSRAGLGLFRQLCGAWAGDVRVHRADALSWLHRTRRRFDVIVDDLSVAGIDGQIKPPESLDGLPELIPSRLSPRGIAIVNLLPVPDLSWARTFELVSAAYRRAVVIGGRSYDNRVVLAGRRLPDARRIGRSMRDTLARIGSRERFNVFFRTF
ncbi:MAG: hypothetical protein JSV80_02765 [Acidobacteriota bacterium]|nr:MAG: hypothetical protein JSV80_02765 [Acidobacteriota bacterium]